MWKTWAAQGTGHNSTREALAAATKKSTTPVKSPFLNAEAEVLRLCPCAPRSAPSQAKSETVCHVNEKASPDVVALLAARGYTFDEELSKRLRGVVDDGAFWLKNTIHVFRKA